MNSETVQRPLGPWPNERGRVLIPVRDAKRNSIAWVTLSTADYGLGMRRSWTLDRDGYPRCAIWRQREKKAEIYLHRLVARASAAVQVDHIHHDLLDCRRSQLRHATPSQNTANRRRPRLARSSSSRYRGVTWHAQTGKWQAACHYQGKCIYLGLFTDEAEAAKAYDKKAFEIWGRFAVLNNVTTRREAHAA